ncbi:hypothetical protein [Dactylosporangium sp. CS-033363]|uniref:hypothetical protein n=1 Tax=Dactylosporangium sp. CS-033363 TaxID=3239935 RepID=UPI003D9061C6
MLPGSGRKYLEIASVEGHQRGPGLSWPELAGVAARQPDPVRRAQTLLLLAPAFGDAAALGDAAADTPAHDDRGALERDAPQRLGASEAVESEAVALLSAAMRTLGAPDESATAVVASRAVSDDALFWGPVHWVAGAPESDYASRNPASAYALPDADRKLLGSLLAP